MQDPMISIWITYYNDKDFISESIDSILSQSMDDFELILLNHASTDGSKEICRSYCDKRIVHIDMDKNYGAGSGLLIRKFYEVSKGKYVKLFCADDIMMHDCLKRLSDYLESNQGKDIVFSDLKYVEKDGIETGDIWSKTRPYFHFCNREIDLFRLLINGVNCLPYPTVLIKKCVFDKIYIDNIAVGMFDMFLWASMVVNDIKFGFIHDVLVKYRQHKNQICTIDKYQALLQASGYESYIYTRIFNGIHIHDQIEYICDEVGIKKDFNMSDRDYIMYIVGRFYMNHEQQLYRSCGFIILHDLLQDDEKRLKIIREFNFDIDNLRVLYRSLHETKVYHPIGIKGYFKNRIQGKNPFALNLIDILVLVLRKFYKKISKLYKKEATQKYTA